MKLLNLKNIFSLIALEIASTIILVNSVQAQTARGFRCDTSTSIPTTVYQNSQGLEEPWIKWVSDYFSSSNLTPLSRCRVVSKRLEQYRVGGTLQYLTLGVLNQNQIICVSSSDNGPCEGMVYRLKPGQDAIAALNNLFAWRVGEGVQLLGSYNELSRIIPTSSNIGLQE